MFKSGLLVISLPTLLLWTAWAQDDLLPEEARLRHITANTAQLTCAITLDRSVYLPGESVVADIDVSNATAAPLEVLDPLRMGRFSLYRKAEASAPDGLEWEPMWEIGTVVADHTTTDLMSGVVATVFQPNYRVQRRLSLMRNRESEPAHQRVSNLAPGEYKLQYYPCGASASFRVVPVDGVGVMAQATAPWLEQRTEGVRVTGQPAHCAGVVAGVLRSGNEFVTVASDVAHDICDEPHGLGGTLTKNAAVRRLAPFTRLSAGKSPASSLTIRSDATGESTIELVDQERRRQVFRRRMTEASQVR